MASLNIFKYTGGASNSDPDASLGGTGSSVDVAASAENNLFDNVTPPEAVAGDVNYRAIDIYNDGDLTAYNCSFYFTPTPNTESELAVWYDSTGTQSIPDEDTEPTGASGNWTEPTEASQLSLPDLAAGARLRLWIRRTVDAGAVNITGDQATLHTWFS